MMELPTVHQPDHDTDPPQEVTPDTQTPPESDSIDYLSIGTSVHPRVGDEYQVNIPPLLPKHSAELEKSDPYRVGLALRLMWVPLAKPGPNESVDMNESLLSIKAKTTQARKKKTSKLDKQPDSQIMKPKLCKYKTHQLVPGSLPDPWGPAEADSFLLGLYIYGKNFVQVEKFMGKGMGEIMYYYYKEFYKSDKYKRWCDCRKVRSRKCVYGRKLFGGWRLHVFLNRLLPFVPVENQSSLLEVSKSFNDGTIPLEDYISTLKKAAGIHGIVKSVGIGSGKEDLTSRTMEPIKNIQLFPSSPEVPVGRACSSLSTSDIIKYLTGDFRLTKARYNDIFWEAVWPRMLAQGWHSEQPIESKGYHRSNDFLVFLRPGVKEFKRRKLVKGDHYYDSVTAILKKVAAEPELLEVKTEEIHAKNADEDQTDVPNDQKFTIMDTSLADGRVNVRELRCYPTKKDVLENSRADNAQLNGVKLVCQQKVVCQQTLVCQQIKAKELTHAEIEGRETKSSRQKHKKYANNAVSKNGVKDGADKFTIIDTSLVCTEKSSGIRELRHLPDESQLVKHSSRKKVKGAKPDFAKQKSNHEVKIVDFQSNGELDKKNTIMQSNGTERFNDGQSEKTIKQRGRTKPLIVTPVTKSRKLSDCVKTEMSRLAENSLVNVEEELIKEKKHCSLEKQDSAAEAKPENGSNKTRDQFPKETNNEEGRAMYLIDLNKIPESDNDQDPIKEAEEGPSSSPNTNKLEFHPQPVPKAEPEPELEAEELKTPTDMNPRRQSTRNRPLTTRFLESLETGFCVTGQQNDVGGRKRANPFSNPTRKPRSRARVGSGPASGGDAKVSEEEKEKRGPLMLYLSRKPPTIQIKDSADSNVDP